MGKRDERRGGDRLRGSLKNVVALGAERRHGLWRSAKSVAERDLAVEDEEASAERLALMRLVTPSVAGRN